MSNVFVDMQKKQQLRNEEGGTALHMPSAGVLIQTFQSRSQPSDEPNNLHMLNSFLVGEPPGYNPGAEMFAFHKSTTHQSCEDSTREPKSNLKCLEQNFHWYINMTKHTY